MGKPYNIYTIDYRRLMCENSKKELYEVRCYYNYLSITDTYIRGNSFYIGSIVRNKRKNQKTFKSVLLTMDEIESISRMTENNTSLMEKVLIENNVDGEENNNYYLSMKIPGKDDACMKVLGEFIYKILEIRDLPF